LTPGHDIALTFVDTAFRFPNKSHLGAPLGTPNSCYQTGETGIMGSRFLAALAPTLRSRARPIMNGRDYDLAKKRLAEAMDQPGWMQETSRIEALSVAISDFEVRYVTREVQLAVEWAECVFIPPLETAERRRWSD
jgi:hypothetical protein